MNLLGKEFRASWAFSLRSQHISTKSIHLIKARVNQKLAHCQLIHFDFFPELSIAKNTKPHFLEQRKFLGKPFLRMAQN